MLTDRQLNILRLIIQIYTATGAPVGSKVLMAEGGVEASSATIRNEMSLLEDLGLLEKTHSSSGRVPSRVGYRYYVDNLLTPKKVPANILSYIRQSLGNEYQAINDIIEQSAKILSDLTSYTAFSLGPEVKERKLTGFRIVPLNNRQIIAMIITDRGNVENQVFTIPKGITSEDIEKMVRIINDRLIGEPLLTVYHKLRTEIPMILQKYFRSTQGIMDLFELVLSQAFEEKVFVSGQMNLLNNQVLSDLDQFKSVYQLIDNADSLTSLITPQDNKIDIRIGAELDNELLNNMSMVTTFYEVTGHGKGIVALLGPTNMSYANVLGIVDAISQELSTKLTDYYRSLDTPTL